MSLPEHLAHTQESYDTVAADYARLLPSLNAETRLDVAMIDNFADLCTRADLGPIVDAGCGTGRVTSHLAARGLKVIGIDLSAGMVEVARGHHPDLRFEVGTLDELPVPEGSLGGLLAWYSLIHTAPSGLPAIFASFARALVQGGWVLMAFQAGEGQRVDRTAAYGHAVTLTNYRHDPDHVVGLLESGGFDIHARLHRAAEATEKTPQSILLVRKQRALGQ